MIKKFDNYIKKINICEIRESYYDNKNIFISLFLYFLYFFIKFIIMSNNICFIILIFIYTIMKVFICMCFYINWSLYIHLYSK